MNPRKAVYELLLKADKGAYSPRILDAELKKRDFSQRDKAFVSFMFYGVLERLITLDYIIGKFSKITPEREVRVLLRMALYQILFMDSVPERAAVNESVELAPQRAKGYINAVLRNFLRKSGDCLNGIGADVQYSCPLWLIEKWRAEYGEDNTAQILKATLSRPPLFVRVNAVKYPDLPERAEFAKVDELPLSDKYHVQDLSSQEACELLEPRPGETVIDLCAAPGGKSFTIAQLMGNAGRVVSCDINPKKLALVSENAKRLGLDIIETTLNDAKVYNPALPRADRVLCDVPCSGLGVIRRKPEIKYKPQADFEGLPLIQGEILRTAAMYVKDGGTLMYSTCTLSRDENENVVEAFLSGNKDFALIKERTVIPSEKGGDGFFTALMAKAGCIGGIGI